MGLNSKALTGFARSLLALCIVGLGLVTGIPTAEGYTVVSISTSAPSGLEQALIQSVTSQYQANVFVNPFVANTYQITVFGPNPSYNPPVTNKQLLDAIVTVDSYTYVQGWANGESYQQSRDIQMAYDFMALCSTAPYYNGVKIDSTTCVNVSSAFASVIYQLQLSTPVVVPGNWQ